MMLGSSLIMAIAEVCNTIIMRVERVMIAAGNSEML